MAAQPGAALDGQRSVRYPAPLHVGPRWGRGSPGRAKSQRGNVIYSPAPSHQERGRGKRSGGKSGVNHRVVSTSSLPTYIWARALSPHFYTCKGFLQ